MNAEPNDYSNPSNLESFALKKSKGLKVHIPENKRISKARLILAPTHAPLRSRAQPLPKDSLKNQKNLEKVRKQLKLEQNEREEMILEETAEEEEELRMEDQATHQPAANGMEEETVEKRDNAGSWPGALMIN